MPIPSSASSVAVECRAPTRRWSGCRGRRRGVGMSRTYVAMERSLSRRVVVKVLSPDIAAGVSVDRFRREILLAAQMQHPHVVPVLSAGDASGRPWFTMPYVEGESLRARLARGPLSTGEAVSVL